MDSFTTITRAQPHRLRRERLSREHSGGPSASVQSGDSSPSVILFFIPPRLKSAPKGNHRDSVEDNQANVETILAEQAYVDAHTA